MVLLIIEYLRLRAEAGLQTIEQENNEIATRDSKELSIQTRENMENKTGITTNSSSGYSSGRYIHLHLYTGNDILSVGPLDAFEILNINNNDYLGISSAYSRRERISPMENNYQVLLINKHLTFN